MRIRRCLPAAVARVAALTVASAFGLAVALPGRRSPTTEAAA
jgi:hypothetical protein